MDDLTTPAGRLRHRAVPAQERPESGRRYRHEPLGDEIPTGADHLYRSSFPEFLFEPRDPDGQQRTAP